MDVILHIGAHRTASTSFQAYMRSNARWLTERGIGFWGPHRTRNGLLRGVVPVPGPVPPERQARLAGGRIAVACEKSARAGVRQLVVSDENMLGAPRANLRAGQLYPEAGARIRRYLAAFGGGVSRIVLSIRSPELFWASSFAFAMARGHGLPDAARIEGLAASRRGWRDVIADIAAAAPDAELLVLTHEEFGAMPERRLWHMTGERIAPPLTGAREWLNRSPGLSELRRILAERGMDAAALPQGEGRWMPFSEPAQAAMRERYSDELFWLSAGADGLARLARDRGKSTGQAAERPPPQATERGPADDKQDRRMVGHR